MAWWFRNIVTLELVSGKDEKGLRQALFSIGSASQIHISSRGWAGDQGTIRADTKEQPLRMPPLGLHSVKMCPSQQMFDLSQRLFLITTYKEVMTVEIELIDLGDATEQTKQCTPWGVWSDSWFQFGSHPYPWYPGQCG